MDKEIYNMDKKDLIFILSNFDGHSGTQLRYYIYKSFFPEDSASEMIASGLFNASKFSAIRKAVEEKNLPLLKLDNCADATLITSPADGELQSKFDRLEEELKAARETIAELRNTMEEKDDLHSKCLKGYQEENLSLRKDVDYFKGELKKRQIMEPSYVTASHSANNFSNLKPRTPEPTLTPEEMEDIWG
jgi:hypothetical protein